MASPALLPDYRDVEEALISIGAWQQPAEMHGWFSGFLAVGERLHRDEALAAIAAYLGCRAPGPDESALLFDLYEVTRGQYGSGQMELEILAPPDEADLSLRSECLVAWCKGFLAGFAEGGKRRQKRGEAKEYGADVAEALSDIAAIAELDIDSPESEDSDSQMFAVSEYVRMAAISVYVDCVEPATDAQPPERLH